MSHERKETPDERSPHVGDDSDDLNLSSESPEVRARLVALAKRRALLRNEKWRALARGTASVEEVEALKEKASASAETLALFEIARPKPVASKPAVKRKVGQRIGTALLLAAGAMAVWFGKTAVTSMAPTAALPMPAYEMNVQGGAAATLGDDDRHVFVLPTGTDTRIDVKLSPPPNMLVSRYKDLRGQAFIVRFGTILPLDFPIVIDSSGAATFKGTRETLFPDVPAGVYDVWIAVGPESEISANPEKVLEQLGKKERTISISRITVQIEGGEAKRTPLLDVRFTGCTEVVAAPNVDPALPECLMEESAKPNSIRLRIDAAPGAVLTGRTPAGTIEADLALATTPAGTALTLDREKLGSGGDVVIEAALGQKRGVFRLPLRYVKPPADFVDVASMARKGDRAGAYEKLTQMLTDHLTDERQSRAHALMGRIDKDEKRYAEAIEHLRKAREFDRKAGRLSAELSDGVVLSEVFAVYRHDPGMARKVLRDLVPLEAQAPEALVKLPYYGAGVAAQSGDLRATLRLYDTTLTMAQDLDLGRFQEDAKFALAEIFVKLGRIEDARRLQKEFLDRLNPKKDSACYVADTENQAGWVEYLAGYAARDNKKALEQAKSYFEQAMARGCDDPFHQANVRTNLALVALALGNPSDVRTHLERAKQAHEHPGPFLEDWWTLIGSRVLILEAQRDANKAKAAVKNLESLLGHAVDAEVRLDAWLARAEAYDVLNDRAAREAYVAADVDALRYALGVELTTGAGAFLAVHGRATERRIDYLLRLAEKQPQNADAFLREAVDAARRSRLRILASLPGRIAVDSSLEKKRNGLSEALQQLNRQRGDSNGNAEGLREQQKDVNLAFAGLLESIGISPDAPLSSPSAGELLLVYHPLGRGYVGFAVDAQGKIHAKRLDISALESLSPRELSARVLEPFRAQIQGAQRIRLAPHGATLARVDFHALPWGEGAFIDALPVTYAVDLGGVRPELARRENGKPGIALLVTGDSNRTLPGARRETEMVTRTLGEKPGFVIKNQPTASSQDIRGFLDVLARDDVQLFHFVGHGQYQSLHDKTPTGIYQPDLDGYESGIRLQDGNLFSARRVMSLARVPSLVIMSACEVGNMVDKANGLSFGLPQAFIVKGARFVVAATVPLGAGTAEQPGLHEKLVEALISSPEFPKDIPAALRQAQMQLRRDPEWASFRVFVP